MGAVVVSFAKGHKPSGTHSGSLNQRSNQVALTLANHILVLVFGISKQLKQLCLGVRAEA